MLQAAGIVNVADPSSDSPNPAYVVHIFPPCDWATANVERYAPELITTINDLSHLLIVVATCQGAT